MLASSAVLTIVANVMPTLGAVLGLVGMGIGTVYAILPTDRQDAEDLTDAEYLVFLLSALGLVLTAGMMSGLTLGLMSLDDVEMEILITSGKSRERKHAERVRQIISKPHKLLVTLVVWNAIAAESLPLVLDRITDPVTSVVLSVTVVLLFGEIIPQALCTTYGLAIGAFFAPLVNVLLFITQPISIPIAALLDTILGQRHSALFRRTQLRTFVDLHDVNKNFGGKLSTEEVTIIKGALDLTHKRAKAAMTPLDMVFMLSIDAILDAATLESILKSGHSRILVHKRGDRTSILGTVLVKELILVDPNANQPVSSMKVRHVPHLLAETPMYDMLRLFKTGRTHMAVLTQPTLEAYTRAGLEMAESADHHNDGRHQASLTAMALMEVHIDERDGDIEPRPPVQLVDDDGEVAFNPTESNDPTVSLLHSRLEAGLSHQNAPLQAGDPPESPRSTSSSSIASITDEVEALYSVDFASAGGVVAVGIITIEDVLEELLGDEIVDETDEFIDVARGTRVNKTSLSRSLPPYLRKALITHAGGLSAVPHSPVLGSTINRGSRLSVDQTGREGAWERERPRAEPVASLSADENGDQSSIRKFNVLISNDDGVSAPGLRALVLELEKYRDVALYVCGPFGERSGQSNAITIGGRGPLHAFQIPSIGNVIDSYAVDGTPADSVIVACRTNLVVEDPTKLDLVVSGINRGDNSGIHVVYSGTCGAAREANHHGLPAIAVSLDDHNARAEGSYARAARIAAAVVRETLDTIHEHKEAFCRTLINVNVPGEEAFEGLHMCRQGRHSSTSDLVEVDVEDDFHERNAHKDTAICLHGVRKKKALRAFRHMNFRHVDDQTEHTDFALLSKNWATVTVLDSLMDVPLRPEHFTSRYDEKHIGLVRGIVKRVGEKLQCRCRDDQGVSLAQ